MGLGSPQAEVGDVVAVFFGSDVPFVLRPQEDKFRLIGETHVQGIMDEEVIDSWKHGIAREQWWMYGNAREQEVFEHPTSLKEKTFIIV